MELVCQSRELIGIYRILDYYSCLYLTKAEQKYD